MTPAEVAEVFLVRTIGGPFPGDRQSHGPWPLPDTLPDPEMRGEYVKVGQSQLPDGFRSPHVMRGVQYEWRAALADLDATVKEMP